MRLVLSFVWILTNAVTAFFFHDKISNAKNDWGVTGGESFYFSTGSYKYDLECRYNAPGTGLWTRVGFDVYTSVEPLKTCFECRRNGNGDPVYNPCSSRTSDNGCDDLKSWPVIELPRYRALNGKQITANYRFWTSSEEKRTWADLSNLYCSCVGVTSSGSTKKTTPTLCKATIWGIGWDYSNWIHWIILVAIVIGGVQILGIIGLFLRKSKSKTTRQAAQLFICQHCVVTQFFKILVKLKKKIAAFAKKRKKKSSKAAKKRKK